MSRLTRYYQQQPRLPLGSTTDAEEIRALLAEVGVRFERWRADQPITATADQAQIGAAYRNEIDRLMQEGGYQSWDVISMQPDHPDRVAMRQKFLDEHIHAEDEVRFFVAGEGLFNLHIGENVYALLCQREDLISVPAGTRHWFDMGDSPNFTAIRLFTNPAGWVAQMTGDEIGRRFPAIDHYQSDSGTGVISL